MTTRCSVTPVWSKYFNFEPKIIQSWVPSARCTQLKLVSVMLLFPEEHSTECVIANVWKVSDSSGQVDSRFIVLGFIFYTRDTKIKHLSMSQRTITAALNKHILNSENAALCNAVVSHFQAEVIHFGLHMVIIPPEQRSCWGVYWFHFVRLSVRLSVRPSVCPGCRVRSVTSTVLDGFFPY